MPTLLLEDVSFWDVVWWMIMVFFFTMFIWMFIAVFADIFGRDISGWAKAGWALLILVLPFIGILIYIIARPKPSEEEIAMMQRQARAASGISPADEIARAQQLRQSGAITEEEFQELKRRAMA
jgi:hypothetical protein